MSNNDAGLLSCYRKGTTPQERADILDSSPWGKDFSWEQTQVLAEYFVHYEIPPNTTIIKEGCSESYLGLVLSGSLNVSKIDEGEEKILTKIVKGQTFGEMSLVDSAPRSANVTTIQTTEMLILARAVFEQVIRNHPAIAVVMLTKIAKLLSLRLRQTSGKLTEYLVSD